MSDYESTKFDDLPLFDGKPQVATELATDQGVESRNETFAEIMDSLTEREKPWLLRIVAAGDRGVTLYELSEQTGIPQNAFSGRITSLQTKMLVKRTKERRPTLNSTASVIVATDRARQAKDRQLTIDDISTQQPKGEELTMNTMPDQLTCNEIPTDQDGEPMQDGRCYRINGTRVQCFDKGDGYMMVQPIVRKDVPVSGSRPQLISEFPANTKPFRLDD